MRTGNLRLTLLALLVPTVASAQLPGDEPSPAPISPIAPPANSSPATGQPEVARAEPVTEVVAASATTAPPFATLDRQDGSSRAGASMGYLFVRDSGTTSATPLRLDLWGQYVVPSLGIGAYAQVPVSYLRESAGANSDSGTGFGDIEVGGIYAPRLPSSDFGVVLHAGITVPSGSSAGGSGLNGGSVNLVGAFMRLDDFALAVPGGITMRVGVSPMIRTGRLFARADLGADVNFSAENQGQALGTRSEPTLYRLNVGVGVALDQVALTLESVNVYATHSNDNPWIDVGAISARYTGGTVHPYAAVTFPLDTNSHRSMSATITVGADIALR